LAFQPDGSLACSGDEGGIGRVWDLRTGRAILPLEGHAKQILAIDFSPNGYQIATGSEDHTIRIWDLRARKSIYSVPAHSALITNVRFQVQNTTTHPTAISMPVPLFNVCADCPAGVWCGVVCHCCVVCSPDRESFWCRRPSIIRPKSGRPPHSLSSKRSYGTAPHRTHSTARFCTGLIGPTVPVARLYLVCVCMCMCV
jgi:WD40 repeat protein